MYWDFTNKELIGGHKNSEKFKNNLTQWNKTLKQLTLKIERLQKKIDFHNELLDEIQDIKTISRGVAILEPEYCRELCAGSDINRGAQVYHNANTPEKKDDFGLILLNNTCSGEKKESFCGLGYTKKTAMQIALDWISLGKKTKSAHFL